MLISLRIEPTSGIVSCVETTCLLSKYYEYLGFFYKKNFCIKFGNFFFMSLIVTKKRKKKTKKNRRCKNLMVYFSLGKSVHTLVKLIK